MPPRSKASLTSLLTICTRNLPCWSGSKRTFQSGRIPSLSLLMREEPRGKTRGNFALGWIPEMILTLGRYLRFNAVVYEVGTLLDISQILFMFKLSQSCISLLKVEVFMKQCYGVDVYIQCQGELKSIIGVPTMTGSKNLRCRLCFPRSISKETIWKQK